jgi:hypothetical protein
MKTAHMPLAILVGVTALTMTMIGTANAQSKAPCAPRAEVVKSLDGMFKETPAARAIVADGALMEVFVSSEGTWTMLLTSPQQMSCLVGSGDNWEELPRDAGLGHSASLTVPPATTAH